jgi:hypothetical protein
MVVGFIDVLKSVSLNATVAPGLTAAPVGSLSPPTDLTLCAQVHDVNRRVGRQQSGVRIAQAPSNRTKDGISGFRDHVGDYRKGQGPRRTTAYFHRQRIKSCRRFRIFIRQKAVKCSEIIHGFSLPFLVVVPLDDA